MWIDGRASDVINRGGNKVFPEQVEEVLRLSPNVADAAVVAGRASDDELDALCREHLVAYKVPVAYHHVDALPRSEVGKLVRRQSAAVHSSQSVRSDRAG